MPTLVTIFFAIHHHYRDLASSLSLEDYGAPPHIRRHRVILPISGVHRGTLAALRYARSLSDDVTAVHVSIDPAEAEKVSAKWENWGEGVRWSSWIRPTACCSSRCWTTSSGIGQRQPNEMITIVVPQFVPKQWWHNLLHTQTASLAAAGAALQAGHRHHGRAVPDGVMESAGRYAMKYVVVGCGAGGRRAGPSVSRPGPRGDGGRPGSTSLPQPRPQSFQGRTRRRRGAQPGCAAAGRHRAGRRPGGGDQLRHGQRRRGAHRADRLPRAERGGAQLRPAPAPPATKPSVCRSVSPQQLGRPADRGDARTHRILRTVFSAGNGEVEVYEILQYPAPGTAGPWTRCVPRRPVPTRGALPAGRGCAIPPDASRSEAGDVVHVSATWKASQRCAASLGMTREA